MTAGIKIVGRERGKMEGMKISEATLRESLEGTENLPIVDDSTLYRTTIENVKEYAIEGIDEEMVSLEDNILLVRGDIDGGIIDETLTYTDLGEVDDASLVGMA